MHPSTKTTNSSFDKAHASALHSARGRWILIKRLERGWVDAEPEWTFELYSAKGDLAEACWMKWGASETAWVKKVDRVWWGQVQKHERESIPLWAQPARHYEVVLLDPMGAELSAPAMIAWGAQRLVHPQWNGEGPIPGTGIGAGRRWRRSSTARRIKATITLAGRALLEASSLLNDDSYRDGEHWRVVAAAALRGWATRLDDIADRDPDYSFQRGRRGVGWKEQRRGWQCGGLGDGRQSKRGSLWKGRLEEVEDLEPGRR